MARPFFFSPQFPRVTVVFPPASNESSVRIPSCRRPLEITHAQPVHRQRPGHRPDRCFRPWTAVRSIGARPVEPKFPFPKPASDAPLATAKGEEKVVLAGGCFWGVQAVFEHMKGVTSAVSGYAGGHVESPGYER